MKIKLFSALFALLAVSGGAFVTAPAAEAACSYNGYLNSNGTCSASYKYTTSSSVVTAAMLEQYIRQLQALLAQLQALEGAQTGGGYGTSDVDVTTQSATDVEDENATLRGEVDFNNEDEATVYFRWGTSAANLSKETTNIVLDEDDGDETFEAIITNLNDDTTYYFRAVAEDENGDRDYGAILSFRSDDNNNDDDSAEDAPSVDVDAADDVTESSAKLHGSVDMNDFKNGEIFFVYGEDEDQVSDIADDYDSYQDVDEDDEDLQKILVDNDLDDEQSYWATMTGLNEDTEIFYTLCVAYEDEDGDDVIVCGDVEDFTTDEN